MCVSLCVWVCVCVCEWVSVNEPQCVLVTIKTLLFFLPAVCEMLKGHQISDAGSRDHVSRNNRYSRVVSHAGSPPHGLWGRTVASAFSKQASHCCWICGCESSDDVMWKQWIKQAVYQTSWSHIVHSAVNQHKTGIIWIYNANRAQVYTVKYKNRLIRWVV